MVSSTVPVISSTVPVISSTAWRGVMPSINLDLQTALAKYVIKFVMRRRIFCSGCTLVLIWDTYEVICSAAFSPEYSNCAGIFLL
jgi:hypothetical protein